MTSRSAKSRRFRSDVEKAVALFYEQGGVAPPRIVAKGTGRFAEQLIGIAFENGVKVRKDADLAEILSQLDVESEIPVEVFAAVAEILSYVYQANGTMMETTWEHSATQSGEQGGAMSPTGAVALDEQKP